MEIKVTVGLEPEDRKRVDALNENLAHLVERMVSSGCKFHGAPGTPEVVPATFTPEELLPPATVEAAKDLKPAANAAQPAANAAQPAANGAPETPETPDPAPAPTVTADELMALVRRLAGAGSPHRGAAKEIVRKYGATVSQIPESSRAAAYAELSALEG